MSSCNLRLLTHCLAGTGTDEQLPGCGARTYRRTVDWAELPPLVGDEPDRTPGNDLTLTSARDMYPTR